MARYWIRCTWVNQWDYRATNVEFIKTWCIVALSTFRIVLIVEATVNTFKVFFYTKESQSFVKPSSFKSRALKFSTKSIINAVLSTNLLFFFTLCHIRGLQYRCLYTPICKHILESLDSIKRRACAQNVCFSILLRFSNWLKAIWNTYLSGKFCLCFIFQNAYMSALLEAL